MKKSSSQEAYYERLRNLADVNKKSIRESQNRSLGTLIDYKRAADGVAYGIVKENHQYYIKKGGLKQDPNVSDFAYIDGLANITNYQYKSLAEADKQRNLLLHVINEATTVKVGKTGSRQKLNEDKVSDEIEQAEEKLDAAETATEVPAEEPIGDTGGEMPIEEPAPEGGDEVPAEPAPDELPAEEPAPEGGEELPAEEPTGEEGDEDIEGSKDEIKSDIGKIGDKILQKKLNDKQVVSYVNMFLGYFKDNFLNMEQSELNDMAGKINELHKEKNIEDLEKSIPTEPIDIENPEGVEEAQCAECGSFAQYAESRGYTKESLMECGEEEMGSLIGGYANAYGDGENEGDHKTVALFIKLMPKVLDILRNEYGHEEYAGELEPEVNSLSESSEEDIHTQINELFGGLKSAFGKATQPIKQGAQAVSGAVQKGAQAVQQYGQGVKQAYHAGEVSGEVKKLETLANNLGQQIAALNTRLTKAGKQPVNVNSILTTIKNQIGKGGTANLATKVQEEITDVTNTEILPENDIKFAPAGQSLGAGVVKPEGAPVTTKSIMSEAEQKLRKYIRARLEEKTGLRKPVLNESKKSKNLKKLDKLIENQFILFETNLKKKVNEEVVSEIWGLSLKEKFQKINPQNESEVDKVFKNVFSKELTSQYSGAFNIEFKRTDLNRKYEILDQYFTNNGGTIAISKSGGLIYTKKSPFKQAGSLSGMGFNAGY